MKDFFENVSRYPRYFISFTLGTLLAALRPILPLFQRPITAIPTIGFLIAGFAFIAFTLRAMLGLGAA
ncbi:DUF751 family protein [Oscillatoria sp. FACHB-1407]|uniref:DUF751 family protein n=1 Tax=Oscillatoria sp. FACHB-1407 TaxID=2692847 RepID=UPI001686C169|nr:DUF751 family protein [Oscillatoria sp. FACHB-1407]MBD2463911.1 DUF751 family protein [Oscillatoria sp. FACHB-1407]